MSKKFHRPHVNEHGNIRKNVYPKLVKYKLSVARMPPSRKKNFVSRYE